MAKNKTTLFPLVETWQLNPMRTDLLETRTGVVSFVFHWLAWRDGPHLQLGINKSRGVVRLLYFNFKIHPTVKFFSARHAQLSACRSDSERNFCRSRSPMAENRSVEVRVSMRCPYPLFHAPWWTESGDKDSGVVPGIVMKLIVRVGHARHTGRTTPRSSILDPIPG